MSAVSIRNQLCVFFGGPYDPATRCYRTPQIDGLGAVFRARPKREDKADYHLGTARATTHGSTMIVQLGAGSEERAAIAGATSGLKLVRHEVIMHVFTRSSDRYAEDALDADYELLDAIRAHIQGDRTAGSGGIESSPAPGFHIGEGGEPWLAWDMGLGKTEGNITRNYFPVTCEAHEYVQA